MKTCPSCGISVGGAPRVCPLCHGALLGEATEPLWPSRKRFKSLTTLYKVQLFVVLCAVALFLIYDFAVRKPGSAELRFGVPIAAWALVFELELKRSIHRFSATAKFCNYTVALVVLLLVFTAWYLDFLRLCLMEIIPLIISALLIFNFIATLTDRNHRALPYLLCSILAGLIPYLLLFLLMNRSEITYAWAACMGLSVIALVGTLIFRGRKTRDEVIKRVHM